MISAPNRLLPLNGNKLIFLYLISLIILACGTTAPSTSGPTVITPDQPQDREEEVAVYDVDTIQWIFDSADEFPPISAETKVASFGMERVRKDYYRIALMLPMRVQGISPELDPNNRKFAEFYAGIKMATQQNFGVDADVKVYYTNRDASRVNEIIRDMSYSPPDLIIGPYVSKLISQVADFAEDNRIPIISPWKLSSSITEDNIFFLQMRPAIEQYFARIVDHVNFNFDRSEISIIQRPGGKDRAKTRMIEKINQESSNVPVVQPYNIVDISLDSLMDAEANVFDTLLDMGTKAFILPHFLSSDERFIYSCLRKMYGEKNGRDFFVYTMPVSLNSERIDINLRKNLNIRTPEFRFPDPLNPDISAFKKEYLETYGWLPTEDSFYGFDLMTFILYGLSEHGQYFHYYMAGEDLDLLQMKVRIEPYFKEGESRNPEFMVNNHLYIIEYDGDRFVINDYR